jgi:hypothetical protein
MYSAIMAERRMKPDCSADAFCLAIVMLHPTAHAQNPGGAGRDREALDDDDADAFCLAIVMNDLEAAIAHADEANGVGLPTFVSPGWSTSTMPHPAPVASRPVFGMTFRRPPRTGCQNTAFG